MRHSVASECCLRAVSVSFPQQQVKHGGATEDAVLPQSNWLCSSGGKAGESKKKARREENGFRQDRGSKTIHILEVEG